MAQIIKHRRGSIDSLKGSLARKGELVIATGSIGNMNGPWVFVGDNDANGAYKPTSQIYRGNTAPTISNLTYGSTLDGTPFYSITSKSLFILDSTGNAELDLTGNIEGNTISGVTINNLQSTNVTASFVSGAFIGDATGLYNIPASGVTGLNLSKIYSGSVAVETDSAAGTITLSGGTVNVQNNTYINGGSTLFTDYINNNTGDLWISSFSGNTLHLNHDGGEGNIVIGNSSNNLNTHNVIAEISGSQYAKLGSANNYFYTEPDYNEMFSTGGTDIHGDGSIQIYSQTSGNLDMWANNGTVYLQNNTTNGQIHINARNSGTTYINTDAGQTVGDVHVGSGANNLYANNVIANISGSQYAELESGHDYIWVEAGQGAFMQTDAGTVAGVSVRESGVVEVTGSFHVNGNTEVTGTLVVTSGAAFIDQGVVAQNSNVILTSGSSLIIQDGGSAQVAGNVYITGSEYVDYIYGKTNTQNYLAFNGGAVGAPGVELNSSGNISLWAEGGNVTVTGSLIVSGDITMKGNINLGDSLTGDTINFNGEISSSLVPSGSNLFDLGSPTNAWRDLYVSGTAHIDTLSLGSIQLNSVSLPGNLTVSGTTQFSGSVSISGLTEGRAVFVGTSGSLVDYSGFTFDSGSNVLTAGRMVANDDSGNGQNFLVGNDVYIGDINQSNTMMIKGAGNDQYVKIQLANNNSNAYLESNNGAVRLNSNDNLNLISSNSHVYMESYGGTIYLNDDSGDNVRIGGRTYISNQLRVDAIHDYTSNTNYMELYGYGTNNAYWWESGQGDDTTLWNNRNTANLNIVQTNGGKVNIDAPTVNLHTTNGFNVTGSMVVSDASGVFNSSLISSNSNLTLTNGSNLDIQDNGTITVSGQAYFHSRAYFTGDTRSDNYYGLSNTDNALHLNGGIVGAPHVELASSGQISLWSEGGGSNYAINLTGSVYSNDNITINNGNSLNTNYINGAYGNDLTIASDSNVYLRSYNSRNIELISANAESGTNYLWVQNNGVGFQTYDVTSDKNHTVYLDNTGSLKLTNVDVKISGSLSVDGNTTYNNDLTVAGNMYVSGNFTVLGTGSLITLSGSQVDIGTNKILLNTYAPFERFAGIDVYDSGSNVGVTGSLLWDSLNNVWIYSNPSGSNYASARFIAGPMNTGSLGEETGLTNGHFPIAVGDDHIGDSLLTYQGTTLALNTNKFTVDSDSGNTLIHGNFTIEGAGATDNGTYSSYIVFRNSDNVLGFVDTADTGNVTDRLLGYNATSGVLEFSSLIDGGTY